MKSGTILLLIACFSICCQKINNEISVPLVSSVSLPNCQTEKFTFTPPNLSSLTEGIDYILISPNIISGINNNEQFKGNNNSNLPPCNTWNTLIHEKLLLNPTIKYILFQPGDYRCLGPLYLANIPINPDSTINGINGRELTQSNKCIAPAWTTPTPILSLIFYDFFAIDKFTPIDQFTETPGNAYNDRQVVLQGLTLDGCSNILVRGLIFDPI